MINLRELRVWTALLKISLCLFTISSALPALRYGLASLFVDASSAPVRLSLWTADGLVGPLAKRDLLTLAPPAAAASRVETLRSLLSATPMSGGAWLDLAVATQEAGASMEQVANALALSSLTGPNEARFMAGRASFGVPLWSKWPPDVRRTLIGDLVGGWGEMQRSERADLDALLTVEADKTRDEIRAALLLAGAQGTTIADALELTPEPAGTRGGGAASSKEAAGSADLAQPSDR